MDVSYSSDAESTVIIFKQFNLIGRNSVCFGVSQKWVKWKWRVLKRYLIIIIVQQTLTFKSVHCWHYHFDQRDYKTNLDRKRLTLQHFAVGKKLPSSFLSIDSFFTINRNILKNITYHLSNHNNDYHIQFCITLNKFQIQNSF